MKIQNEIEVTAPPDELFDVLADVERVAPLLPGANLEEKRDDESYAGTVKVKVGPITASFSGSDSQSLLSLDTDLDVRGKAAQFGRGALGSVSQRLLQQFARNLESEVLSGGERTVETPSEEPTSTGETETGEETTPPGETRTSKPSPPKRRCVPTRRR